MLEKIEKAFLCFENSISQYGYYLHPDVTNFYARFYVRYLGTRHFDISHIFEDGVTQVTKIGFGFEKERQGLRFYFTDKILIPVKLKYELQRSLKLLERVENFGKENSLRGERKKDSDAEIFFYTIAEFKLGL